MNNTYYTLLATEHGQAIQCARCGLISYNPNDVEHRYCGACKLFLDQIAGPLPPLTLGEFQVIFNRLYRFLTAEREMRNVVFPEGGGPLGAKRMAKLTQSEQALNDLVIIKNILKQQFAIAIPDPTEKPAKATQPSLLDVPTNKPTYH